MAFVNSVKTIVPSFGSPFANDTLFLATAVALSTTGSQTKTLSGLSPTVSRGYVRVKIYGAGGTTPAIVSVQVIVSDGTTFVLIGLVNPTTAIALGLVAVTGGAYGNAGILGTSVGGMDFLFPFIVDISCTQFSVITTLSGTTPTASMDVELSGVS